MSVPLIPAPRLLVGWLILPISCIVLILCMVRLYIADDKKATTPSKRDQEERNTKILAWCTFICYFIFSFYVLISRLFVFVIINDARDTMDISCIAWAFPQIVTFMGGRIFLYILWLQRFRTVFNESMFAKRTTFYCAIRIGIIVSMVFSITFYLAIYASYSDHNCQLSGASGHLLMAGLPFTVFDLGWSAFLLYLFVNNLFKVLHLARAAEYCNNGNGHHADTGQSRLGVLTKEIHNAIKKLNILVNISILSTWIIFVSVYSFYPLSSVAVDSCINSICILLSLASCDGIYTKMCRLCVHYYEPCFMKYCCCCCKWCHDDMASHVHHLQQSQPSSTPANQSVPPIQQNEPDL